MKTSLKPYLTYRLVAAAVVIVMLGGVAYEYQISVSVSGGSKNAIPKGTGVNLIPPDDHFADGVWQRDGAAIEISPSLALTGTGIAERLVETEHSGFHRVLVTISGLTPGAVHTFSAFVKPAQRKAVMLEARDEPPQKSYGRAAFDMDRSAVFFRSEQILDAGIVPITDGWYRCWISLAYATDRAIAGIALMNGEGAHQYQGDGRSGSDLWGVQFELGGLNMYAPYSARNVPQHRTD
jgi:hypothetical protein